MLTLEKKAFDLSVSRENEQVNAQELLRVFAICFISFMLLTSMYHHLGLFQSSQTENMEQVLRTPTSRSLSNNDAAGVASTESRAIHINENNEDSSSVVQNHQTSPNNVTNSDQVSSLIDSMSSKKS
uniref:Uncharacterized protein n=1 Tax=Norrisiella sphaerica TaxID=552664 RepID=A0A7S2QSS3_9EUKA|mmetsp:Transcript_210/g.294  ORF Transcript_210/g.294 Transcript_210/m.294 type:complete len:127 (+) Transcript_210:191-571(+)